MLSLWLAARVQTRLAHNCSWKPYQNLWQSAQRGDNEGLVVKQETDIKSIFLWGWGSGVGWVLNEQPSLSLNQRGKGQAQEIKLVIRSLYIQGKDKHIWETTHKLYSATFFLLFDHWFINLQNHWFTDLSEWKWSNESPQEYVSKWNGLQIKKNNQMFWVFFAQNKKQISVPIRSNWTLNCGFQKNRVLSCWRHCGWYAYYESLGES